jgi:hypothetical protein
MNFLIGQDGESRFTIVGGSHMIAVAHEIKTQHIAQGTMIFNDKDCKLPIGIFSAARDRYTLARLKRDYARFTPPKGWTN